MTGSITCTSYTPLIISNPIGRNFVLKMVQETELQREKGIHFTQCIDLYTFSSTTHSPTFPDLHLHSLLPSPANVHTVDRESPFPDLLPLQMYTPRVLTLASSFRHLSSAGSTPMASVITQPSSLWNSSLSFSERVR